MSSLNFEVGQPEFQNKENKLDFHYLIFQNEAEIGSPQTINMSLFENQSFYDTALFNLSKNNKQPISPTQHQNNFKHMKIPAIFSSSLYFIEKKPFSDDLKYQFDIL